MFTFKKFLCVVLTLCMIACCSLPVLAVESGTSLSQQAPVEKYNKNGYYVTTVNVDAFRKANMNSRSANVSSTGLSVTDIELMNVLGYDERSLQNMGQAEIESLLNSSATITTTSSYYHYDEGTDLTERITKETYLQAQATLSSRGSNDGSNAEVSSDGYFHIITSAAYQYPSSVNDEKGWYVFSGTFSFIGKMPKYRMTDAASLFADEVMWSQSSADSLSRMTYYYYVDSIEDETSHTQTKTTTDKYLYSDGLYYTWKLPGDTVNGDIYVQTVTDIEIYVRGVARVSDYTNYRAFNLFTKFEHSYSVLVIQPSFSWSYGAYPGVSADVNFISKSNTYASLCEIDYNPSIYLV